MKFVIKADFSSSEILRDYLVLNFSMKGKCSTSCELKLKNKKCSSELSFKLD